MAYIDYEYIKTRLGEAKLISLTQTESSQGVNIEIIDTCCQDASILIDRYCSQKYETPFDNPSDIIKNYCFIIARFYLMTYNRIDSFVIEKDRKDPIYTEYEKALVELEKISRGEIKLKIENDTPLPKLSDMILFKKNMQLFTQSTLKGL
jgi:phage gp36-like protein